MLQAVTAVKMQVNLELEMEVNTMKNTNHSHIRRAVYRDELIERIGIADKNGKEGLEKLYKDLEIEKQQARDLAWAKKYTQVLVWEELYNTHGVRILPTNQE